MPAFLAARRPTSTAPLTEVSASVELGEYLQALSELFFCEVIAARTASSSAWPTERGALFPVFAVDGQRFRSSTAP